MEKITFEHGGKTYDEKYPDGIPTSVKITSRDGVTLDSGLIMYPAGHARNTDADIDDILVAKFKMHGDIAMEDPSGVIDTCRNIEQLDRNTLKCIWDIELADRPVYRD